MACMLRFHIAMYVKRLQISQRATPAQLQRGRSFLWIQDIYLFPKSPGIERVPTFTRSRTHSLTHSLSHSHSHSLTPSLTLSLSLSLSLSLTHSPSLSHSLTHSVSHSHSHYQQLDRSSNSSVISRGLRGAWVWEHVVLEDVEEAGLGEQ